MLILASALITCPLVAFSDAPAAPKKPVGPTVPAQAKVITTPTSPIVKNNANLFFSAEYLLMTATEGGISYARQNFAQFASPYGDQKTRKCYELDLDWNSGFRLGMGYNMGHDRWDTKMTWTWMLNHGHDHQSDMTNQLYSTNAMPGKNPEAGVLADSFSSHINIHLNLLDWQLGREFFLSKWLKVRPFAGLKTGWVHQDWKTKATGHVQVSGATLSEYVVKMKQKFWGIGPMIGMNSEWGLVSNLSLYANGSFALLTGFFDDHRNDIAFQASPSAVINNPFSKRSHNSQSLTELQLGLRWNQWCGHDRYRLSIQAGWDAILFNDHNHYFAVNGQGSGQVGAGQTQHLQELTGDLMFQGMSVGCRLDF